MTIGIESTVYLPLLTWLISAACLKVFLNGSNLHRFVKRALWVRRMSGKSHSLRHLIWATFIWWATVSIAFTFAVAKDNATALFFSFVVGIIAYIVLIRTVQFAETKRILR